MKCKEREEREGRGGGGRDGWKERKNDYSSKEEERLRREIGPKS